MISILFVMKISYILKYFLKNIIYFVLSFLSTIFLRTGLILRYKAILHVIEGRPILRPTLYVIKCVLNPWLYHGMIRFLKQHGQKKSDVSRKYLLVLCSKYGIFKKLKCALKGCFVRKLIKKFKIMIKSSHILIDLFHSHIISRDPSIEVFKKKKIIGINIISNIYHHLKWFLHILSY